MLHIFTTHPAFIHLNRRFRLHLLHILNFYSSHQSLGPLLYRYLFKSNGKLRTKILEILQM